VAAPRVPPEKTIPELLRGFAERVVREFPGGALGLAEAIKRVRVGAGLTLEDVSKYTREEDGELLALGDRILRHLKFADEDAPEHVGEFEKLVYSILDPE
jgi:hypothetical protein